MCKISSVSEANNENECQLNATNFHYSEPESVLLIETIALEEKLVVF